MFYLSGNLYLDMMVLFFNIGSWCQQGLHPKLNEGFFWIQYSFERGVSAIEGLSYYSRSVLLFCSHTFRFKTPPRSFLMSPLQLQIFAQRNSNFQNFYRAICTRTVS